MNESAKAMSGAAEPPELSEAKAISHGYLSCAQEIRFESIMQQQRRCCGKCDFFDPHDGPCRQYIRRQNRYKAPEEMDSMDDHAFAVFVSYDGVCRRSPPIVDLETITGREQSDKSEQIGSYWPEVEWSDWCGEFEPRPQQPQLKKDEN